MYIIQQRYISKHVDFVLWTDHEKFHDKDEAIAFYDKLNTSAFRYHPFNLEFRLICVVSP